MDGEEAPSLLLGRQRSVLWFRHRSLEFNVTEVTVGCAFRLAYYGVRRPRDVRYPFSKPSRARQKAGRMPRPRSMAATRCSPWRLLPCRAAALSRSTARHRAARRRDGVHGVDTRKEPRPWQAGTRRELFWGRETGRRRPGRRDMAAIRRFGGGRYFIYRPGVDLCRTLDRTWAVVIDSDRGRVRPSAHSTRTDAHSPHRPAACRRPLRRSAARVPATSASITPAPAAARRSCRLRSLQSRAQAGGARRRRRAVPSAHSSS